MPTINEDSAFGKAILTELVKSPNAKQAIAEVGDSIINVVIVPILTKLKKDGAPVELTGEENDVIKQLAEQHSSTGKQWGAVMPHLTQAQIMSSDDQKIALLEKLSQQLSSQAIEDVTTIDEMGLVLKSLVDCSFCYVEKLNSIHSPDFTLIKDTIFPTPEEFAARISRKDLGQKAQSAIQYGIGTIPGVDIAEDGNIDAAIKGGDIPIRNHATGKSFFGEVSSQTRAKLVAASHPGMIADLSNSIKQINQTIEAIEKKIQTLPSNADSNEKRELTEEHKKLLEAKSSLELKSNTLILDLKFYTSNATAPKSGIEKLAARDGIANQTGATLPLIATTSGSTGRVLIALEDLGAFTADNGGFDATKAQYVAAGICGAFVHGGHHSVLEVGEAYNRLLDYDAIKEVEKQDTRFEYLSKIEGELTEDESSELATINALRAKESGSVERSKPYYIIGDSGSLIPEDLRPAVIATQGALLCTEVSKDFKAALAQSIHQEIAPVEEQQEHISPPPPKS
jgi:hypothetical protein